MANIIVATPHRYGLADSGLPLHPANDNAVTGRREATARAPGAAALLDLNPVPAGHGGGPARSPTAMALRALFQARRSPSQELGNA